MQGFEASATAATSTGVVRLVEQSLRQTSLSGLREMLKILTEDLGCYGCILWEVAPFSDLSAAQPTGSLFILEQYFRDGKGGAFHSLPLDALAGKVALTQKAEIVTDVESDSRVFQSPFLRDTGIKSFHSVPLTFVDGSKGALNFFHTARGALSSSALRRAAELASLVPALYQSVRERVSLDLIGQVNAEVQDALAKSGELAMRDASVEEESRGVLARICERVGETFACAETSLFLEDWLEAQGEFTVRATTWPLPNDKPTYRASAGDGLTGWVLERKRSVRIFDLNHYDRDREQLERLYPGLCWKDSLEIRQRVWEVLGHEPDPEMPLSVMAAPVVIGTTLIGMIRCAVARARTYFSERDLRLLELVAAQIAHYWTNILSRRQLREENRSLKALVDNMARLNTFAFGEISRGSTDERPIFREALVVTRQVFPWAEALDVRLPDDETSDLVFSAIQGAAWQEGTPEAIEERRKRRVPADALAPFTTGVPEIVEATTEPDSARRLTFPGMNRLTAPIRVGDDTHGLLDIRTSQRLRIPEYAVNIAQLLGNQLGLYHHLATIVAKLRSAEADLKKHASQQQQIFQDLCHQLQTPISQAHARAQAVLEDRGSLTTEELSTKLLAIRGLLAKSTRVTSSLRLFVALAQKRSIALNRSRLDHEWLQKMLIEAAMDQELLVEPGRRVRFVVERGSFDFLKRFDLELDRNLLEQAVASVLDNAGKYSYANTQVEISGGLTQSGRPYLAVSNQGIRLRPEEVRYCTERGWRSEAAESVVQEGSGIGLWIVDSIMRAHRADLLIEPTNDRGRTVVRFVFSGVRKAERS